MSIHNLDKIFQPESIAVVAPAKERAVQFCSYAEPDRWGAHRESHSDKPRRQTVWEKPAYPSILDLKSSVDLAILATLITSATKLVKECVEVKVGSIVIISASGKEIGPKGRD